MENIAIAIRLVAVVASVFTLFPTLSGLRLRRRTRLHEDYKFLQDYIAFIRSHHPQEDLLIEKGYLAFSGYQLRAKEIIYLINMDYPSRALDSFCFGREFIELTRGNAPQIVYTPQYKSRWKRRLYKYAHLALYFLFAVLAIFPAVFLGYLIPSLGAIAAASVALISLLLFGMLAVLAVRGSAKMVRAEALHDGKIY